MIYLFDSSSLSVKECEDAYRIIASHFHDEEGRRLRKENLCGRLLLHMVLSESYCIGDYNIFSDGVRKPYIDIDGMFFNISHSGNYVLCAVDTQEVGCDVEVVGEYKQRIAERFFTHGETELISKADNKAELFFKLWTVKESILKYFGEGFSGGLSTYDFSRYAPKDNFSAYGLNFRIYGLCDAFVCICGEGEHDLIDITQKKIKDFFSLKGDTNENTKFSQK